jgi:hypothetical protein
MSKMSDLILDIYEEIEKGELSFQQIANKYEVPLSWVDAAYEEVDRLYEDIKEYDLNNTQECREDA